MRNNARGGFEDTPTDRSTDAHRGRGDTATEEQRTENEPPRGGATAGTRGSAGEGPRPVGQSNGQTGKPADRELVTDGGQERGPVEIYGYEVSVEEVQPRYEQFLASTVNREVDKGNEVALRKCVVTIRLRKRAGQSTYQHTYDVTFAVMREDAGAVARATRSYRASARSGDARSAFGTSRRPGTAWSSRSVARASTTRVVSSRRRC